MKATTGELGDRGDIVKRGSGKSSKWGHGRTGSGPRSRYDRENDAPSQPGKRPDFGPGATYNHGLHAGWADEFGEENIRKAQLKVCSDATDAADARLLLEALGLVPYLKKEKSEPKQSVSAD